MLQAKKQRITIIGSGPVGLFTAILLKRQYGKFIDVTLLDSHITDYERPGIIAKKAVQAINEVFVSLGIPAVDVPDSGGEPANSIFIGDLQRALLLHAERAGVNLLQEAFASLEKDTIKTKKNTAIPSDLVIDCSGEGRVVVNFTNEKFGSDSTFQVERIANNPIKQHFIAYVHMDEENSSLCRIDDLKKRNPVVFVQTLEKLRKTFGWQEFAEPEMVVSKWDEKGKGTRYCFYFEIPPQMAEASIAVQQEYLKALLTLKTGNVIQFELEEGRFKFNPFDVDPQRVLQPLNTTNYSIPVVACGDAMLSAEYRFGTGVANGITCAIGLVKSLRVTPERLEVSKAQLESELSATIMRHCDEVRKSYQSKRDQLSGANLQEAYEAYTQAFKSLAKHKETESDLLVIEQGLFDLAVKLKESSGSKFVYALECKQKKQLFKSAFQEAESFYKKALLIYENYCPHKQETPQLQSERAKIYSNLAKIFYQTGRINEAISYAEQSLTIAIKYKIEEMVERAFTSLENSCKRALSDYNRDFPNDKWNEKIALNEKMAKMTESLGKDSKPYMQELNRLKEALGDAQKAMKNEVSSLRTPQDDSSTLSLGQ